jgi:hypothetical protein
MLGTAVLDNQWLSRKLTSGKIAFPRLSDEQRRAYECLKVEIIQDIQAGLNAFQRAGKKLIRIRDERLYREEYDTFEDFCKATLGKSKTYINNVIQGYELIQALIAQGETVLPDSERLARQLAKYPKGDRKLIWKRAVQIAGRKKPSYKLLRQAATEIVPTKEAQKIWMGQLLENLRSAKRSLTVSIDLRDASRESVTIIAMLLVDIEKRVSELSVEAGARIKALNRRLPRR